MPNKKEFWEYIEEAINKVESMPILKGKCHIQDKNGHHWYMRLAEVDV